MLRLIDRPTRIDAETHGSSLDQSGHEDEDGEDEEKHREREQCTAGEGSLRTERDHDEKSDSNQEDCESEEERGDPSVVRVRPFRGSRFHSDALHDERPEFPSAHVESEVRPLHITVERSHGRAYGDLAPFDEPDVLVPQDEAAETAIIPQLEVHDSTGSPILAGERADRRDARDRRPQVRLHAFLEVRDPRERGHAPPVALDDDHRRGIAVEQVAPFLDHGLDLSLERLWLQDILHLFIEGRAHGRRTREHTKGLSRAQPTGVLFLLFKGLPALLGPACPKSRSLLPRRPSCPVLGKPLATACRRTGTVWPSPSSLGLWSMRADA